jgi:hypothetical protein
MVTLTPVQLPGLQESILGSKNGILVCRDQSPASEVLLRFQEPVLEPEFLSRIRKDNADKNEVKDFSPKFVEVKKQEILIRVVGLIDSKQDLPRKQKYIAGESNGLQ